MRLLLDDKTTRGYNLNANEACIFAAILKCTRAGRAYRRKEDGEKFRF